MVNIWDCPNYSHVFHTKIVIHSNAKSDASLIVLRESPDLTH